MVGEHEREEGCGARYVMLYYGEGWSLFFRFGLPRSWSGAFCEEPRGRGRLHQEIDGATQQAFRSGERKHDT